MKLEGPQAVGELHKSIALFANPHVSDADSTWYQQPVRALIIVSGTRGDMPPSLAQGLRGAGHDITIATSSTYADWIREHGRAFVDGGPHFATILTKMRGPRAQSSARSPIPRFEAERRNSRRRCRATA